MSESKYLRIQKESHIVKNYITADGDNLINLEDKSTTTLFKKEADKPLSALEHAKKKFKEKKYKECIHILKYQYIDLDKDDAANYTLSLCYSYLNNQNEAIIYINKAIELNESCSVYYTNKGYYLFKMGLFKDALDCYNQALKISPDDEHVQQNTKNIIDLVNLQTKFYTPLNLIDEKKFEEYIFYFDSIINLQYCFPEYKQKFKYLKKVAVSYFFKKTEEIYKKYYNKKSYQTISNRCQAILKVANLNNNIKFETQKIQQECLRLLQPKEKDFLINPLPNPRDKHSAISEMINEGYTKSEMIEQLSSDFGISKKSAEASINSYYKDDDSD
ncbi:MAG: tetratricopeptide repeat protein [Treponema sp.]|nr:tetratricopeptide repeat protein [Treponema sp.]